MLSHRLVLTALLAVLLPILSSPAAAQQPSAVPDSAAVASPLVDSLQAALKRFENASPPTASDSARLRRRADSVQAKGNGLRRSDGAQARALLRRALNARRAMADSAGIAEMIGDLGVTWFRQARYAKAIDLYQEALDVARTIGKESEVAASLSNIGLVYKIQGRYEEAHDRFRESLEIEREIGNQQDIATSLNNIGLVRKSQGRYEEAHDRFRESLEIYREIGDQTGVAYALGNIGLIHQNQGRYEEAHNCFQESLEIFRELGDRRSISTALTNIGEVHADQGRSGEALARFRKALRISQEVEDPFSDVMNFKNIGEIHLRRGRLAAATDTLGRAVRLAEQLRKNATSPEARRSLLSTQIGTYRALTHAHVRANQPDSALRSAEQAQARLLADRLYNAAGRGKTMAIPAASEVRRTLDSDETALLYANAGPRYPLTALVVTRDTTIARTLPDSTVRAQIGEAHPVRLNRLRREDGPLSAALDDASSEAEAAPSLTEAIRLYRHYLTRAEADASVRRDLARQFHNLLIDPVTDAVPDGHDEWVVVPTGMLGYLPFETLRDSTGTYLVQKHGVRYAQSLTVLRWLQVRDHGSREKSLLAVGGAAYMADPTMDGDMVIAEARRGSTRVATEAHASALLRDAERSLEQGRSPRTTYARLGYQTWMNLPGTREEAEQIGAIAGPGTKVLTGEEASEPTLRSLSDNGQLDDYRRLHFATHGVAVPEVPALSALVLSQVGTSDSLAAQDGYLTMEEIADLNMKADVAVLSACQTGLGKVVAGEGVVSLSHAFFRAGANATLVSQWKVLDESTHQFMTAVYERANDEDTSFAEAVTETKRAFIEGEYGEKNTDPLRWAPFVYYGRE